MGIKTIPYYGGKTKHAKQIVPLLPATHSYVEPFAGSGAVLFAREPSAVETYNDADGEVVNFFRVLRDSPDEMIRRLEFTPFSRAEFESAVLAMKSPPDDPIERARCFLIRVVQGRHAKSTTTKGQWRWSVGATARGMSAAVSSWCANQIKLIDAAERLLRVQIENLTATECIKKHDSADTLFYCDPPYLTSTRVSQKVYGVEMTDADHAEFLGVVTSAKGLFAISGYDHPIYNDALSGWVTKTWDTKTSALTISGARPREEGRSSRIEKLWMNYEMDGSDGH